MEGSGCLSDLSTGGLSCHSGSLFYLTFLALLLVMSSEFLVEMARRFLGYAPG